MKHSSLNLSAHFEPRISPAEFLGDCPASPYLKGIKADAYEVYFACRGPNSEPVSRLAQDLNSTAKQIYEICSRTQFKLDKNILALHPEWACRLVPLAIDLRVYSVKLTQAEDYLKLLVAMLPRLNLPEEVRTELLGFTWEHLGGILLHRDQPEQAANAYATAAAQFGLCLKSAATIPSELLGYWKHRELHCRLNYANASRMAGEFACAQEVTILLLQEVRELDAKARKAPRSFQYRGHRFQVAFAEILRIHGAVLADTHRADESIDAVARSIGTMEDADVVQSDPNQLVASCVKLAQCRAKAQTDISQALDSLDEAEEIADRHKEVGVYRVFIDSARALLFHRLRERDASRNYAEQALRRAKRLGLYRHERILTDLLDQQ